MEAAEGRLRFAGSEHWAYLISRMGFTFFLQRLVQFVENRSKSIKHDQKWMLEALQTPFGQIWGWGERKRTILMDFRVKNVPLLGGFWGTFLALFSFRLSGTLKKGGPGGPSKLGPSFCRFWGLRGGPQEGSCLHGSSIFTFAP